jgi:hypothetical protein
MNYSMLKNGKHISLHISVSCHYECFNFVDFHCKQFIVCKIWDRY